MNPITDSNLTTGKPYLATDRQKNKDDQQLVKDMFDYYDMVCRTPPDEAKKMIENLNLHVGRWPDLQVVPPVAFNVANESVMLGGGQLHHYPLIDRVTSVIVSDIILRPLIPIVKDTSSKARNQRERTKIKRIQEYIDGKFLAPVREQIRMQVQQELGIQDPFALQPKEMEEYEKQVSAQMDKALPDAIADAMERNRLPGEIVMQAFLDDFIDRKKVKHLFDLGGEIAVATGYQYYMIDEGHNEPRLQVLPPTNVGVVKAPHTEWIEDGIAARYTHMMAPEEFVARFGHKITKNELNKVLAMFSPLTTGKNANQRGDGPHTIDSIALDMLTTNYHIPEDWNPVSREGQEILKDIYRRIPNYGRNSMGIQRSYITFRWTRDAVRVTRVDPKTNKKMVVFRPANYQKSPFKGDISVERTSIPQVWHGDKIGTGGEAIYLDMRPVAYQYNDLNNPFNVKLTIFGGSYNTVMGMVRGTNFVDLGKPWQYRYNVLVKRKEEKEATDVGRVLMGTFNMKPRSWTWQQFFQSLLYGKIALVNTQSEGLTSADMNAIRTLDLSQAGEYARILDDMAYTERMLMSAMYVNQAKLGEVSPYATNQVSRMNQAGADKQLLKFNEWHRLVKENVLNGLLRTFFATYKDNESLKDRLLDDFGRAYFENMIDDLDSYYELHVVDDFEESKRMERMQELLLAIMQNGGSMRDIADVINAKNMAEVLAVADRADRNRQKQMEQQQRSQEQMATMQQQMEQQMLELKQQFDNEQKERDRQVKLEMSKMQSELLRNANDVNDNKITDALERDMFKQSLEERRLAEMVRLKEQELALKYGQPPGGNKETKSNR